MTNNLCKCGCAQEVSKPKNTYLKGHYFKGKKRPDHSNAIKGHSGYWKGKKRLHMSGENHYFYNKKCPEHSERMLGVNNPNWKGGDQTYCAVFSDKEWRKYIFDRDKNACQSCGISGQMNFKLFGCKLSIHHIDHDKHNCNPNNCTLLCNRCNAKAENKISNRVIESLLNLKLLIKSI